MGTLNGFVDKLKDTGTGDEGIYRRAHRTYESNPVPSSQTL